MSEQHPTPPLNSLMESGQQAAPAHSAEHESVLPYPAPDHRPNPEVEPFDMIRGCLLAAASLLLLISSLVFSSSMNGRDRISLVDSSAVPAVVWPATAVFLLASAVFSLRKDQRSARRQRVASLYAISAAALCSCAIVLAAGFLPTAAAIVAALASILSLLGVHQLNRLTARTKAERWLSDAPLSFLAGFSMAYTLHLWFAVAGWNDLGHSLQVSLATAAVSLAAAGFAHTGRGRHALASGFGIAMIAAAINGWLSEETALWVSAICILMSLLVFLMAENRRFRISHAEHRALRGKPVEF
ncbi:hypothetical protein [Glutamicibacter sp. TV12E]|uniref:hypothetical protein n=1 Tax=Glutamicibacter sp. TV12E TaxID=3446362 RepID=UPI004033194B